jgi:hypothetical protein
MSARYNTTYKQQLKGGNSQTLKNRASQDGGKLATKANPNKTGLFARFKSSEILKELSEYNTSDFNGLNLGDYQDFAAKFFKLPKGNKDESTGTSPTTQVGVFNKITTEMKKEPEKNIYLNGLALGLMGLKSPADTNEKYITDKLNSIIPEKYLIQKYETLIGLLFTNGTAQNTRLSNKITELIGDKEINGIFLKSGTKYDYMDQLNSLYQKMIEKNININIFYLQFVAKSTITQEKNVIANFREAQNKGLSNLLQNSLSGNLLKFFYGDQAVSTSETKTQIAPKQNNCEKFKTNYLQNFNNANSREIANSNYKELLKCNYQDAKDTVYSLFKKIGVKEITTAELSSKLNKITLDTEKTTINNYLTKINLLENINALDNLKYTLPEKGYTKDNIQQEYTKYINRFITTALDNNVEDKNTNIKKLFSFAKQNNLKSLSLSDLTKDVGVAKEAYSIIQELVKQSEFKDLFNPLQMNTLCKIATTNPENCQKTTIDVAQAQRAHNNTNNRYDDILNKSLEFYKKYESYITDKYKYLNEYSLDQLDRILFGEENIHIKQRQINNGQKMSDMPKPTNGKLTFSQGLYPIYIGKNMLRIISNHKEIKQHPFIYASNFNLTPTVYINGRQNIYNSTTTPVGEYYVMEVGDNTQLDYKPFDNPNEKKVLGILSSLSTMDLNSENQTISSGLLSAAKTVLTTPQSQESYFAGGGPIGNIFKNIARKFKSVKKRKFGKKPATVKKSAKS